MKESVINFLKTKGISVINEDIDSKLEVWRQWYKGDVDGFHNYHIYNGRRKLNRKRKTLNMASQVCCDWADLLLNEKVEINVGDDYTQKALNRLLKQVKFNVRSNNLIEASFALGGGFFIQYWDGEKVGQKYVTQDYMYPITYDSGRLIEAGFASSKTIDGKNYTYLEVHTRDINGFYVIDNFLLKSDGKFLTEVDEGFYQLNGIEPKIITKSKRPCFQMIRPNVANRDSFSSPFGMSVFSGATDILQGCDSVYDAYCSEVNLGRKRIFAYEGVTSLSFDSKTGEQIPTFDPNDECFYRLPDNTGGNEQLPIIESNMELRIDELDKALQSQLNLLSQRCGFGNNGYKWENGSVSTATQVISENSKMFRTLKKHEEIIREAVVNMSYGLLYFEREYTNDVDIDLDAEITVDFDDSIIEDTAEIKRQAMLELNAGLIDAIEYYQIVYRMTEEQAVKYYNKIQSRAPDTEEEPDGV